MSWGQISKDIHSSVYQGRKGMLYLISADHIIDKQPKNLKKLKKILLNFLNFRIKINFEKKFL